MEETRLKHQSEDVWGDNVSLDLVSSQECLGLSTGGSCLTIFLHFVHSSYSLQWRSQVPEGLVDESGIPLNKGNIHIAKTSPHSVLTGVHKSFERKADSSGNQGCTIWELLGITLNDMVQEIQNPLCLLFPSAETHGKYRRGKIGQVQSAVYCPYCRRS